MFWFSTFKFHFIALLFRFICSNFVFIPFTQISYLFPMPELRVHSIYINFVFIPCARTSQRSFSIFELRKCHSAFSKSVLIPIARLLLVSFCIFRVHKFHSAFSNFAWICMIELLTYLSVFTNLVSFTLYDGISYVSFLIARISYSKTS